jgi:exodeoxyribonuclease VII small subunit
MSEKKGEKKRSGEAKSGAAVPASPGSGAPASARAGGEETATNPSFEQALARLEKIVQDLEGGELTLEETLVRYEEGARLATECARRLEEAEQRIRVLSTANGAPSGAEADGGDEDSEGSQDGLPF